MPNGLLNKWSIKAFNEAWFRKAPRERHVSIESIPTFFHPLDGVRKWNTMYGSQGFIQYQFIVPLEHTELLRDILSRFADAGVASFLAVLKRMGKGNLAPMSFPTEGWTLSLDLAAGSRILPSLLSEIDTMVLNAGGRHYLAKDAHVGSDAVRQGYPRVDEWLDVRDEMDPNGLWASDLGRRLNLVHRGSRQ
jgi:decaprenylphospho-beta-D-ribofuranose 2-oxidase